MSSLTSSTAYKAIASINGPVDLKKYTKLKPDVAKCLCCEADLDLSGLKELTPQLAEAFAKHQGKLILDGLTSLDTKTAQALKENFKGALHFGGIKTLEDEVAQILSEREAGEGSWKYWPKSVFPEIKKFADTPGHLAFFKKLVHDAPKYDMHITELTAAQAEIVAKRAEEISYSSITTLSTEVAKILASSNQKIWLSGISEISAEIADGFAEHEAELSLGNLAYTSNEVALALSKHKGEIRVGGLKKMPDEEGYIALAKKLAAQDKSYFCSYIEEIGEEIAKIISECDRICLTNLKKLPNTTGHLKLWEKMCLNAKPEDNLSFYGLEEVADEFAAIIAKSPAKASLATLSSWKDEPGHKAYAQRLAKSEAASGSASAATSPIYIKGEFFPNSIAQIFAESDKVETQDVKVFDSSAGNLSLARKLANSSKYINIKKISKEAAKIFSEGQNDRLETNNLEEIDEDSFKLLLASKNYIFLPNLKEITPEVAVLCQGDKSLGFSAVKSITKEVSILLSKGKGSLNLDGLESISEENLKELINREGDLSLSGVKTLSVEQAKILSKSKGGVNLGGIEEINDTALSFVLDLDPSKNLNLSSIRLISEENAEKLSKRTGTLNLEGLEELPETKGHIQLAEKIATSWRVEQPNLENIGQRAAANLANNSTIKLKKLKTITPEVAKELSRVTTLYTPSVNKMDIEVAKELQALKGDLTLGNIEEISDTAFAALCENKTRLTFRAKQISLEKALAMVKVPNLYIEDLEEIPLEIAKCFKGYKGEVYLASLNKLSPEAAKELRKLRSRLSTTKRGDYALSTGL